jgi:thiol:disulfide interchange protein DsbD
MKRTIGIIFLAISLFFFTEISAQDESPVSWVFEVSDEPNVMGMYEITFTATIEEKWHMYSQHLPSPDDGPLPTVFTFEYKEGFDVVGSVAEETKPHSVFDDVFEVQVNYFDGKAVFKQLVGLTDKDKVVTVNGTVSYMVCNESTCLPPNDVPFSFTIKP